MRSVRVGLCWLVAVAAAAIAAPASSTAACAAEAPGGQCTCAWRPADWYVQGYLSADSTATTNFFILATKLDSSLRDGRGQPRFLVPETHWFRVDASWGRPAARRDIGPTVDVSAPRYLWHRPASRLGSRFYCTLVSWATPWSPRFAVGSTVPIPQARKPPSLSWIPLASAGERGRVSSSDYDPEFLTNTWIAQSDAHEKVHAIGRYARYAPELGWRAILAVLSIPDAVRHVDSLADALEMLVSRYGDRFIDRIEDEASISAAFKACLSETHPSPTFPIPEHVWSRLSAAADTSIGPMKSHMARLYADLPNCRRCQHGIRIPSTPSMHPPCRTPICWNMRGRSSSNTTGSGRGRSSIAFWNTTGPMVPGR